MEHCSILLSRGGRMQFLDKVRFASIGILGVTAVTLTAASAQAPPGDNAATIDPVKLFATSCGWCHQSGGRVEGRGPKLAGSEKSDEFIINRIKNGKSPGMPAFGRSFNDDQIKTILGYIRGLQAAP